MPALQPRLAGRFAKTATMVAADALASAHGTLRDLRLDARKTPHELRPAVLFGEAADQTLLLRIFREGQCESRSRIHVSRALRRSGLIAEVPSGKHKLLLLHNRHPAIHTIHEVLGILNGGPGQAPRLTPAPAAEYTLDATRPLGHRCVLAFRLLLHLARASGALSRDELRRRMPDAYGQTLDRAIGRLERARVVRADRTTISFAKSVPMEFCELVLMLGTLLAPRDRRLDATAPHARTSTGSFCQNEDGAPLLFGSDVRLRNLVAIAKHGPLYATELRGLTGVSGQSPEGRNVAPFGRGGLVRTWRDRHGFAVDLDPAFPVALPLRCLLRKLEETYRLPPFVRTYGAPTQTTLQKWKGDRYALFGGPIATSILASIGVLDWTFEALCVAVTTGYDRVVVKKALRTLEEQGILEGDRPRRPGFNVRIVTVARGFIAQEELNNLLRAYADAWPDVANKVRWAVQNLAPRTREHLRRRNVELAPSNRTVHKRSLKRRIEHGRRGCLRRYYALTRKFGGALSSLEMRRIDSNLGRSIQSNWPTFRAFREEAGLEAVRTGKTRRPNSALREECIAQYFALSQRIGFLPNTSDLNRVDSWLGRRILVQWGGFPQFCEELHVLPAHRKRSSKMDDATNRANCGNEYRSLMRVLGFRPNSGDLRRHTDGLYKRITKSWPSFEAFCDDIGVAPPRRFAARSRPGPRRSR